MAHRDFNDPTLPLQRLGTSNRTPPHVSSELIEWLVNEDLSALNRLDEHNWILIHKFGLTPQQISEQSGTLPGVNSMDPFVPFHHDIKTYVEKCNAFMPAHPQTALDHIKVMTASYSCILAITSWCETIPYERSQEYQNLFNQRQNAQGTAQRRQQGLPPAPHPPAPPPPNFPIPSVAPRELHQGEFDPIRNPLPLFGAVFSTRDGLFKVVGCKQLLTGGTEFELWFDDAPDSVPASAEELQRMLEDPDVVYYPQ